MSYSQQKIETILVAYLIATVFRIYLEAPMAGFWLLWIFWTIMIYLCRKIKLPI